MAQSIPLQSPCTLRDHCRQRSRNTRYQTGAARYLAGLPPGIRSAAASNRLAAMGLGYWSADAGVGYTYLNEQAGFELSAVVGLTYKFINPYTQYQSGNDAHLDWAISPYLSEKMHIGAVGYFYNQLTGDSGPGATLGEFKSRVAGIGPQIGFSFRWRRCRPECGWNFCVAISSNLKLPDHAARSIG